MKPLNSGHLRVLKKLPVIKRCPLLGASLTDCHIWDQTFSTLFRTCPLFGMSAIERFHCIMLEATISSFPSFSCFEHFREYRWRVFILIMTACGDFTYDWILTVETSLLCLLIQLTN